MELFLGTYLRIITKIVAVTHQWSDMNTQLLDQEKNDLLIDKAKLKIGDRIRHPLGTIWKVKDIYPNSIVVGISSDDLVALPDILLGGFRRIED